RNTKDAVDVRVNNLAIESAHLSGTVNGSYLHQDNNDDAINLVARVSRADAKFAHFYYPTTLSPDTLSWLDTSIQSGRGKDASVVVRGKLAEFPWADSKKGLFQVKAT